MMTVKPSKVALVTAISTENGSKLADFLRLIDYQVHGIKCGEKLGEEQLELPVRQAVTLHDGDLRDMNSLMRVMQATQPDEIYNLSSLAPSSSADINALCTLRLLQSVRESGLSNKTRFLNVLPQSHLVQSIDPRTTGALHAHLITTHFRETYGMYACNGVQPMRGGLFRGERLVARQFTQALADMACGHEDSFFVESFNTLGHWGQPLLAARMQWLMLQQPKAGDSLLSPGAPQTLRQFMASTAAEHGIQLTFKGQGEDEYAVVVAVDQAKAPALSEGQVILGILPKQGSGEGSVNVTRKIDCEIIDFADFVI
jgi:GDPmannose 4,6-dehydratase